MEPVDGLRIDLWCDQRQATIRDARAESGYTLYEFQGNNVGGGMFNTQVPPFDDVRVRRVPRLLAGALERGLMLLSAGPYGNVVRIIPPLVTTAEEVEQALATSPETGLTADAVGERLRRFGERQARGHTQ